MSLNADSESLSKELGASIEKWLEKLVVRTKEDFDKVRQFAKIESLRRVFHINRITLVEFFRK